MAKRITDSTPKTDGFRMPAEFEPQDKHPDDLAGTDR